MSEDKFVLHERPDGYYWVKDEDGYIIIVKLETDYHGQKFIRHFGVEDDFELFTVKQWLAKIEPPFAEGKTE